MSAVTLLSLRDGPLDWRPFKDFSLLDVKFLGYDPLLHGATYVINNPSIFFNILS